MRSPALAIAWEFRQRHRWGLTAVGGYLLFLAAFGLLELGQPVNLDGPENLPAFAPSFAATVVVPASIAFYYILAVFSFGLSGDLAARQSIYPGRMFTLPVTTNALAGLPMLYGAAAMAVLWLATAVFGLRPSGIDLPLVWPALFVAAFLAWTQALTWMPYGLPGLRVIVAVLWLAAAEGVVIVAIHYKVSEQLMVALLAPQVPLAYVAARFAIARARRGDVPDWRVTLGRVSRAADSARPGKPFASAAVAQAWLERRRHGGSLPASVAILLPFELGLLYLVRDTPALVFFTLLCVLLTPPFMAAFAAATVRKSNPDARDSYGMTPFIATRPLTSAALIGARLKATIWSTLVTWLLVLVAVTIALSLSDAWPMVIERAHRLAAAAGTPRAIALALLMLLALIAATWKQLVQTLYIGLSGREWLVKSSLLLLLMLLIFIWPLADWIIETPGVLAALWGAVPEILAVIMCVKMSAAAWVATRLYHSRLLSDRALVGGAALWLVTVLALYAVLVWLMDTPLFPRYFLLLVAILAVPLARLSAAPLALAWNRHR